MPISDKDFHEILYSQFPALYRNEDAKVQPNPFPLKRFMQVASVGFEQFESEIDGMQLLFNADYMPEKYLDPIGRMLGFDFPVGTTVEEKRRIIKNLPTLYKLKGNTEVYEMLATALFFGKAQSSVQWITEGGEEEGSFKRLNVQVVLEVGEDNAVEVQTARDRFLQLVEYFRPVNVGTSWVMEIFYREDEKISGKELLDFNTLFMNDTETFNLLTSKDTDKDTIIMKIDTILEEFNAIDQFKDDDMTAVHTTTQDSELLKAESKAYDKIHDYRNQLNLGKLGSTMVLNEMPKEIHIEY